jgi:hypothetical protein
MKHLLFSLLLCVPMLAMDGDVVLSKENVFIPCKLGDLAVVKKQKGFTVLKGGNEYPVANYNTDTLLQKVNAKQLAALLADNGAHVSVSELNENEFSLRSHVHGKGGGPITGAICYWGTKGIAYGGMAVGAITLGYFGGGAIIAGGTIIGGELGALAGAGAELAAETGIKAVVVAAGPAVVATIETGALAAGAFGLAIPFLP